MMYFARRKTRDEIPKAKLKQNLNAPVRKTKGKDLLGHVCGRSMYSMVSSIMYLYDIV